MPGNLLPSEVRLWKQMRTFYKQQEHNPDGFDDWGELTVHAVFLYKREDPSIEGYG